MRPRAAMAGCALGALAIVRAIAPAVAEPLRLRGDALAGTASPVGLLTLEGDGAANEWLSAEALVWLGAGAGMGQDGDVRGEGADGDALVIALRARAPGGRAEARLGRIVVTTGALRPLHLDGVAGRARLPRRVDAELFAGVPVALSSRSWDWAVGGRLSRRLGDWGSTGVALLERRDAGRLAVRELGLDGAGALGKADLAAKLAVDAIGGGVALGQVSAGGRRGAVRAEAFAVHRSPAHLIPATSLFSVLGDVASERAGGRVMWRAAPRLDLAADAGARWSSEDVGEELTARATLRLDARGRGAIVGELTRIGGDRGWSGARVAARVPVQGAWTASAELELVAPDVPDGRGALWPWALGAVAWSHGPWDAALAVEASASPEERHRVDALCRLGRRWELP